MIDRSISKVTRPARAWLAVAIAVLALTAHPGLAAAADANPGAPAPAEAPALMPTEPTPPAPELPPPPAPVADKAAQATTLAAPVPSANRRPSLGMPAPAEVPGAGAPEA